MTSVKWLTTWVDNIRTDKADIRTLFRDFVPSYYASVSEFQTHSTAGTRQINVAGVPYTYDSTDTTTADDGVNVLVSASGQRYKLAEAAWGSLSIASASTVALGGVQARRVTITGTTAITAFSEMANKSRWVRFAGVLTLTYNATSLKLPTSANITTAAGDVALIEGDASGNCEVLMYQRKDGTALASSGSSGTTYGQFAFDGQIVASVSANALTIALKTLAGADASAGSPINLEFRSATLTSGAIVQRSITGALSVTVPSGQALGTSNSVPFKLWLVAIDNGGTVELAVWRSTAVNSSIPVSVLPLNEGTLISTTAIATAPNVGVFYSTTARTSVAYRILGYLEWNAGLATAGTWSSGPTKIQPFGPGIKKPGETVQAVFSQYSTLATNSTTTLADTGLSATITPTEASNICLVDLVQGDVATPANSVGVQIQVQRNGTSLFNITANASLSSGGTVTSNVAGKRYDAPGSTSAVTYKTQFARTGAAGSVTCQTAGSTSDMTVTEVMT